MGLISALSGKSFQGVLTIPWPTECRMFSDSVSRAQYDIHVWWRKVQTNKSLWTLCKATLNFSQISISVSDRMDAFFRPARHITVCNLEVSANTASESDINVKRKPPDAVFHSYSVITFSTYAWRFRIPMTRAWKIYFCSVGKRIKGERLAVLPQKQITHSL